MKKILMIIYLIMFFFITIFGLYAEGQRSITIKHAGEQDRIFDTLVINTRKSGYIIDIIWPYYYIWVREPLFDEVMLLINRNRELFDENKYGYEYGSFHLYIEEYDKGEHYSLYLNKRKSSIIFFRKLYELINPLEHYDVFKSKLLELINSIDEATEPVAQR
jgi:hypothetical protein